MKKILLIFTLLVSTIALAQQEVKLNIANALILKTIDASYDIILPLTGFGIFLEKGFSE
ncbi:hypothetical protein N8439_00565 [Polaribacter sp.]|nr:hypothetical protein [Polaribacter sp.]